MGEYISVCGVDEAGRGSLVGEVYCAAVILPASLVIPGLNDSKKLTPKKRTTLAQQIKEQALAWSIATASMDEIIEFNILHATLRAMAKAVEGLSLRPERVLVDGNKAPKLA
ncbi:MAG: ribonuclease HII, partial [Desulfuromonas sp.]